MGSGQFHDVDRRLREYIEAFDPDARRTMHRLKVLCSLACNALGATLVFIAIDALVGHASTWRAADIAFGACALAAGLVASVYGSAGASGPNYRGGDACASSAACKNLRDPVRYDAFIGSKTV